MPRLLLLLLAAASSPLQLHARSASSTPGYIAVRFASSDGASDIHRQYSTRASSKVTSLHSTGNNQAEIAALEERLRQLRDQELSPPTGSVKEVEYSSSGLALDELDDINTETTDSIMFSERWKEGEESNAMEENRKGGISSIVLALVLVVLTGIFSQVPIGNESLQKYQAVQGNPSRIDLGDLNPIQ